MAGKRSGPDPGPGQKFLRNLIAEFPNASSHSLARKAYASRPDLFATQDACRSMTRTIRGAQGQHQRKYTHDRSLFRPHGTGNDFHPTLPPSIKRLDPFQALQLDNPGLWGIISDIHLPFHDEAALTIAIDHLREVKPVGIILNGDVMDFYKISEHRKDPRKVDFWEEIETGREFLSYLRKLFPKTRIIYKAGNHEDRYINWMLVKAPELLDIPEFEFGSIFQLDKLRIEEVKEKRPIRLGKLWVLHGHEFRRGMAAPVNPARGLFLRANDSAIQGDCHRSSHHAETRPLDRHVVSCFSTGCLCQLDADYDPLNKWNHGMATVKLAKDGAFAVSNYRIIHGGLYT